MFKRNIAIYIYRGVLSVTKRDEKKKKSLKGNRSEIKRSLSTEK